MCSPQSLGWFFYVCIKSSGIVQPRQLIPTVLLCIHTLESLLEVEIYAFTLCIIHHAS